MVIRPLAGGVDEFMVYDTPRSRYPNIPSLSS